MAEAPDDKGSDEKSAQDEQFAEETENIFRGFMYHRLTSQIEQEACDGDMSVGRIPRPVLLELENGSYDEEKKSKEQQILGKTLAGLGDQLDHKYREQLVAMTKSLCLTSETAYSGFAKVARKLFESGINWGRIITLLCFGYEIAVSVIKTGTRAIGSFLKKIVKFVVTFIVKEKIASWIERQGGWMAILDIGKHSSTLWMTRLGIIGAIALFTIVFLKWGPSS